MRFRWLPVVAFLFSACGERSADATKAATGKGCSTAATGQLAAADSLESHLNPLNDFYFSVRILAKGQPGQYLVAATLGPMDGEGDLTMPRGGEDLCPLLRRAPGSEEAFIAGFRLADESDTTFHAYFKISAAPDGLKMQYVKAYSIQ